MIPFLPADHQYDFQEPDTPTLTIKTEPDDIFEWSGYQFDTLSPTPDYYGPFHDAMVDMSQDLDPGFHEIAEEVTPEVAQTDTPTIPESKVIPTSEVDIIKIEGEIIHLESIYRPTRTLRKRNTTPNYNEDQRRHSIATVVSITESVKKVRKGRGKRESLTIKTELPTPPASTPCSPMSAGTPDRFSACLPCRKRKIKCNPNTSRYNKSQCATCIRRGKDCIWQKSKIRRSSSAITPTSSIDSSRQSVTPTRATITSPTDTSEEKETTSNSIQMEEIDNTETNSTVQASMTSLAIIKEEILDDILEDQFNQHQVDASKELLTTPLHLSSRAFGRSPSICTPGFSPTSSCSSSPMPNSPQTPQDQSNPLISIIHPMNQSEEDCFLLLPDLGTSPFEADTQSNWDHHLL